MCVQNPRVDNTKLKARVDEGEGVSNSAYINGEHHWESNVTLNAVHMIVMACAQYSISS